MVKNKNRMFQVSVIIPVYNAENYLRKSVESAVNLQEVGEVILVEDNSPDNALSICKDLEKEYSKVKLYRHPNGENRGAGASRNLGIEKATFEFVAFLDADDWFLPNRFEAERDLLKDKKIDGVYGATGYFYEARNEITSELTTIPEIVEPKNLLKHLFFKKGHFCLDALTIKKACLLRVGLFNTNLRLHQDTHLLYKIAHNCKLYPGKIDKAVSMRRVHNENRVKKINLKTKAELREAVYKTFKDEPIDKNLKKKIWKEHIRLKYFRHIYEVRENLKNFLRKK